MKENVFYSFAHPAISYIVSTQGYEHFLEWKPK